MGIEKEGGGEGGAQDMKEATNFFRIAPPPPPINCAFAKCVDPLYVLPLNFGAECADCFQSYIVSVGGTRVGWVGGGGLRVGSGIGNLWQRRIISLVGPTRHPHTMHSLKGKI